MTMLVTIQMQGRNIQADVHGRGAYKRHLGNVVLPRRRRNHIKHKTVREQKMGKWKSSHARASVTSKGLVDLVT